MENYKINPKLKVYEDVKNIYYAKPDKTLAQHNEELHIQKKKLIDLGYINDDKIIELLEYSIEFHDIGKINPEFQVRLKENKKFDISKEVAHNILSIHFIDKKDYDDKNDYESIAYAVFYHHRFRNGDNDSIRADENTKKIIENLLSKLEEKGIKVIKKISPSLKLPNLHTDRNIKLLGLLMKCDHSASGGYEIEYPNDFLEVALNELLNELKFLNMEDAKLKVQINKIEKMTNDGYDEVEFFISTNVGQDLKPLNKIASGGEVSRVMLALKVIFSKVDNIPILIFDEIDTGIGGETVRKIALKLKEIGENTQIISITHSPVIASKASQQFYIEKYVENSKTISRVKKLSAEERIKEIGRMLVGEKINNEVLEIANKMLNEG